MAIAIDLGSKDFLSEKTDVLAVLVTEGGFQKQKAFAEVDAALGGALAAHVERVSYRARAEDVLDVPTLGRLAAARVVLVGTGPRRGFSAARLRAVVATAARAATNATSLAIALGDHGANAAELEAAAQGAGLGAYTFTKYL